LEALREGVIVGLANHTVLIAKDGTERFIDDSAAPIRCKDGEIVGSVLVFRDISENRRAQMMAARLAAIVESSDDAIIGKNLEGIVTSWNDGAEKVFGYSASEMIGKSILRIIPPERSDEEARILEQVRRGEPMKHFETIRVRKDGSNVHISVTVSPIRDAEGKIIGASKVARDITEARRTAEALRGSEERLRLATEAAGLGIWMWQPETDHVVWENELLYKILGIPQEEKPVNATRFATEIVHPDDRATFERTVSEASQTGARFMFKGRVRRADGELCWVELTGKRAHSPGGTPIVLIGTAQDVTAKEQATSRLRQNATLFSTIIERAPIGTFVVDAQFRVKQVNPVAIPVFASVNPLIGRDFDEVSRFSGNSI
jgi:PAS domain S-box-containing protein